jgi:hypothetical protein
MLCVASFIVLAFLGIFSASYRDLSKEAFDCVSRRVTLRPCDTGFDVKIRSKILGKIITISPKAAKWVKKYFELLSWIFVVLSISSLVLFIRGIVFFYIYGSCNGLNSQGFCVFDPTGENNKTSMNQAAECRATPPSEDELSLEGIDFSIFPQKKVNEAENEIVFIGCYGCDFTRKSYPTINKLFNLKPANITFVHMSTKEFTDYIKPYEYCMYKQNQDTFWEFSDKLFSTSKELVANETYVKDVMASYDLDQDLLNECVLSEETALAIEERDEAIDKMGIYGTPTVFVNGKPMVGPKPLRVYRWKLK